MDHTLSIRRRLLEAREWLSSTLRAGDPIEKTKPRSIYILLSVSLFLIAGGVRLLYWHDAHVAIERKDGMLRGLVEDYRLEAQRMVADGGILFPSRPVDTTDAHMLMHPPGYSMVLLALYGSDVRRDSYQALQLVQILFDAAAVVLVFAITTQFLPMTTGVIAGLLTALSPHLSHYSLWLSPDSLVAVPVLLAIFVMIRATQRPRLVSLIAAGALIGLSCWLRANTMLLPVFLGLLTPLLFARGKRLRYSLAVSVAALIVVAPLTIRNWIVYRQLIPISLGAGITLVQGIADYDSERRFGMPADDEETGKTDAEASGRPEDARNLWRPYGIERDRARFSRGLEVIRSNPIWFLETTARRASFMLTYDKSHRTEWPFNTVLVPPVSSEPGFGHRIEVPEGIQPIWETSPAELIAAGATLSTASTVALSTQGDSLRVVGDGTSYGDQFASRSILVERHTDYFLRVAVRIEQGPIALKVTSADRRITLIADLMEKSDHPTKKKLRKREQRNTERGPAPEGVQPEEADAQQALRIDMPFASGNRDEVRLVISNNGPTAARPSVEIAGAELFELGPTPNMWTRIPRLIVRGVQRNVYTTSRLLTLIVVGILLLALAGRKRELLLLLVVPAYYLLVQSAFHTEYRYILAIHYFLFVLAAATLYVAGGLVKDAVSRMFVSFRPK